MKREKKFIKSFSRTYLDDTGLPFFLAEVGMYLPSRANESHANRFVQSKLAKTHRTVGGLIVSSHRHVIQEWLRLGWMLEIRFTRLAPRRLDSDNNVSAFKSIRDGIAQALGISDGDPKHDWGCMQEKSEAYGIRVRIQKRG